MNTDKSSLLEDESLILAVNQRPRNEARRLIYDGRGYAGACLRGAKSAQRLEPGNILCGLQRPSGSVLFADRPNALGLRLDIDLQSIEFNDQPCARVQRETGLVGALDRCDDKLVHHLHGALDVGQTGPDFLRRSSGGRHSPRQGGSSGLPCVADILMVRGCKFQTLFNLRADC